MGWVKELLGKAFPDFRDADTKPVAMPVVTPAMEIIRLKTLNEDMDAQIRELLNRRALTDAQWEDYQTKMKEHREMAIQQGQVIAYLTGRYPGDFRAVGGPHQGLTFGQIVLKYLGQ